MAKISPLEYGFYLSRSDIKKSVPVVDPANLVNILPQPDRYQVVGHGDNDEVRFRSVVPSRLTLREFKSDGTTLVIEHELLVSHKGLELPGAKRDDPLKPFIHANVGVIGSSVALLVASFAGVASKDVADSYRETFAAVTAWIAGAVVAGTIVAFVLQLLRLWLGDLPRSKRLMTDGERFKKAGILLLSFVLLFVPVVYGFHAVQAVLHGLAPLLKSWEGNNSWLLDIFLRF